MADKFYKTLENDLNSLIKKTEWTASVSQNGDRAETVVEFETASPAGEDFIATLVISGKPNVADVADSLKEYIEGYDPAEEALPWVDSSGHGKNGAPDLEELIEDKTHMKGEMEYLRSVITGEDQLSDNDRLYDRFEVTQVMVFPFKDGPQLGRLRGLATVILNDQLQIRGLRIMDGPDGLFVAYPVDPFYKGDDFKSVVVPTTEALRSHIEVEILNKYADATKE